MRIRITIDEIELKATLNSSSTARKIASALPFQFRGNYWGEEIYGTIPVKHDEEADSVEIIDEPGTLAFWPIGDAFCLFWGPTPVSQGDEIRPASAVNVIGKVEAGLDELINKRPERLQIRIEKA